MPRPHVNLTPFNDALQLHEANLKVHLEKPDNEITKEFQDVLALPDDGVLLPHDHTAPHGVGWRACDPRNTSFSMERDQICASYLSNVNNMRSIKAMSSKLLSGRTIKFRIYYYHGNLSAIVKVSQKKFFFEPASEYLAFTVERHLNFQRIPTTVYGPFPVDYMSAAVAVVSPFFSQWFHRFIVAYEYTRQLLLTLPGPVDGDRLWANVAIQLWMADVHSALNSHLALNYDYDDILERFLTPHNGHHWPPRPHRLTAISDITDRYIFDFIIGNTDRGLNDHNNFVYGGCDKHTACSPKPPHLQTEYKAKYAFLDHGSSFHSHKEPPGNPFTGGNATFPCRYRETTYRSLKRYESTEDDLSPFVDAMRPTLPKGIFFVVHKSIFKTTQKRLDKVVRLIEGCIAKYGEKDALSLPASPSEPIEERAA